MKKLIGGLLVIGLLTGCSAEVETGETVAGNVSTHGYQELIENELYYIKYDKDVNFATKYKEFIDNNQHLEVFDTETKPQKGSHNSTSGWYIFTKPKEIKE